MQIPQCVIFPLFPFGTTLQIEEFAAEPLLDQWHFTLVSNFPTSHNT